LDPSKRGDHQRVTTETQRPASTQAGFWTRYDREDEVHFADVSVRHEGNKWVAESTSPYVRAEAETRLLAMAAMLAVSETEAQVRVMQGQLARLFERQASLLRNTYAHTVDRQASGIRSVAAQAAHAIEGLILRRPAAETSDQIANAFAAKAGTVDGVTAIYRSAAATPTFVVYTDQPWAQTIEELTTALTPLREKYPDLDYTVLENAWEEPVPSGFVPVPLP
jgi:hypothetical protein